MTTKPTDIGTNRTGIATSPIDSRRTIQGARQGSPAGRLDGHLLEAERVSWARSADPVGTVPPPATVKGIAKAIVGLAEGHRPTVFIDKLGERLAFERTGTRLYEALLAKFEAGDIREGGPTRLELERIRDDEHRHVMLVRDAIVQVGADPTAMTPSGDVAGVASVGWIQLLTDPRTTLTQCLDVILIAELADNDGWILLVDLAEALELDDLARQFRIALLEEEDHLMRVRGWISAALLGQAGVEPMPPQPTAA
jgi:rubrerythrin